MPQKTKVYLEQITKAKALLRELPKKEIAKTRDETFGMLARDFHAVAQKGYSPEEISSLLQDVGIAIPARYLKTLMRLQERKKAKEKTKQLGADETVNEP